MNRRNRFDYNISASQTIENTKYKFETHDKSTLNLSYVEYIRNRIANKFQKTKKENITNEFKRRRRWTFFDALRTRSLSFPNGISDLTALKEKQDFYRINDVLRDLKHKQLQKIEYSIYEPEAPEKESLGLRWRFRRYFIQDPDLDSVKYKDGDDFMVDDFVIVYPEDIKDSEDPLLTQTLIDLTSESLACVIQVVVSHPLDTIKVKQQTFPKLYKNMFECLIHTYRSKTLYAGFTPAIFGGLAKNSFAYYTYGTCQELIAYFLEIDNISELSVLANTIACFFPAFVATFTQCPADLIKCKQQTSFEMERFITRGGKAKPKNAFKLAKYIYEKKGGIPALYLGLIPTFIREMMGFFIFITSLEFTRECFRQPDQSLDDIGTLPTMFAGVVGCTAAWATTFPADVIKSRIQIFNLKKPMFEIAREIYRKEGFTAFYNGLLSSVIKTGSATATLFVVYECLEDEFHKLFRTSSKL